MKKINGIIDKINDIPLNRKFLLIYVFSVIVPMILINTFFISVVSRYVTQREEKNLNISIDRATTEFQRIIESCINVGESISTDSSLFEKLDKKYNSSTEYFDEYYATMKDKVSKYLNIYDYLSGITIYTSNNSIFNGSNYHKIDNTIINSIWYQAYSKSKEKYTLLDYKEPTLLPPRFYEKRLSLVTPLDSYSIVSLNKYILKMDINLNEISDIFNSEKSYLTLFLVNNNNEIIYTTDSQYDAEGKSKSSYLSNLLKRNPHSSLVRNISIGDTLKGWKLIGLYDKSKIMTAVWEPQKIIIFLSLAIMLFSTFLIFIIVKSYNDRIKKLSKHMDKVEKQQFEIIDINEGKDEIGRLIVDFNNMTEKINSLINDVYKLEIQKKNFELERVRAELNYLQSQINPHFLFNTLNAILVVSTKNNYSDIVDIIRNLSITLRRLLSWKDDIITVEEELSFTEAYMKIEKFRFMDKFEYEIKADKAAYQHKIPKMTIQALVENSCKHGIQAITGIGKVTISVIVIGDFLNISIDDNGKGMDKEKLDEVTSNVMANDEQSNSIGMRNVYRRLLLNYGSELSFNISSEKYKGTTISFSIPIKNDKEYSA